MKDACREFRELVLARLPSERSEEAVRAGGHGAGCDSCAAGAARASAQARARASLQRLALPRDLDGRVVAALFAGKRQDRAAQALVALPRAQPPAQLDQAVRELARRGAAGSDAALERAQAPDVLARLVAEELADPSRAVVTRHVGGLARMAVPAELDARLDELLRAGVRGLGRRTGTGSRSLRRWGAAAAVAVALAVGVLAGSQWMGSVDPGAGPPAQFDFEVLEARSVADLPALARSFVGGSGAMASPLPSQAGGAALERLELPAEAIRQPAPAAGDGHSSASGRSARKRASAQAQTFIERTLTASRTTAFSGRRRIEEASRETGGAAWIHYENVYADGQGRFAIVFDELIGPLLSGSELELFRENLQRRQGLDYRYRDFGVRDLELLFANFTSTDTGHKTLIAGRECATLVIERSRNPDRRYVVSIDLETGLVLRALEQEHGGEQVSLMEFESLDLSGDFSDVAWHQPVNQERPFASLSSLPSEVQFTPLAPKALPPGYELIELATVVDAEQRVWVKQTYSDGIDSMFFLHGGSNQPATGGPILSGVWPGKSDSMTVLEGVPWTVATGNVANERVITAGKVSTFELLMLLQSALP